MSARDWVLGIDFGTSNTAAAHIGPVSGSVEALQLSHNRTTMSSAVFVESPDRMDVGDVALDKAETHPGGFIPAPKRSIAQGMININGYDVPASLPVSAVLRSVVDRAVAAHGGTAPSDLVLTHPEAWSPREIQVLLDAAASLGLDSSRVGMVSEPRAAAHYYSRAGALAPGTRIAVFDFGGGTLDVAVLQANEQGTFDVVAARGDNGLGGKNFDATIRRWLDEQIEIRDPELLAYLRTSAPLDVRFAVDDSIRRAKELLSEAPSATVSVPGPKGAERFQITRDEFEEIIAPAVDRAAGLTAATLADAGVTDRSQLEALYLTGGSSRIPVIHERLKDLGPIATLDDPKTVVAQGALSAAAPIVRGLGGSSHEASRASGSGTGPVVRPGQDPRGSGTPAPQRRGPSRGVVLGSAAAAVLLLGGGAAAFALLRDSASGPAEPVNSGTQTDSASASSASQTPPTTKEGVLASLPPNLASELERCTASGETDFGGLMLFCWGKKNSPLLTGFADTDSVLVTVSSDTRNAQTAVVRIRQKIAFDPNKQVNEVVENTSRTAAAHIDGPDGTRKFAVDYANGTTGVMVRLDGLNTVDDAKQFLTRAGLVT